MIHVRIADAFVVGTVLETWLFGILIALLIFSVHFRSKASLKPRNDKVIFWAAVYLFLSISINWMLDVIRLCEATISAPGGQAIDIYFLDVTNLKSVAKLALYNSQVVVCDSIMIFQLYHMYRKSRWICIPIILSTTGIMACATVMIYNVVHMDYVPQSESAIPFQPSATSTFTLTLCNCLYYGILIALRSYTTHKYNNNSFSGLLRVMRASIESGILWTLLVAAEYVAFLAKSSLQYLFNEMASPVIGITICLILIQSSLDDGESSADDPAGIIIGATANAQQVEAYRMHSRARDAGVGKRWGCEFERRSSSSSFERELERDRKAFLV